MSTIHTTDVGTVLVWTLSDTQDPPVIIDLSSGTAELISLHVGTGVRDTYTMSFTTNGTDGKVEYAVTNLDFLVAGTYRTQVTFTDGGSNWTTLAEDELTVTTPL